jgi:hypothetical protein
VFFTVTQQANSVAEYFAFGVFPAIAGIANSLLQVRIGMGKAIESTATTVTTAPIHFVSRDIQERCSDNVEVKLTAPQT